MPLWKADSFSISTTSLFIPSERKTRKPQYSTVAALLGVKGIVGSTLTEIVNRGKRSFQRGIQSRVRPRRSSQTSGILPPHLNWNGVEVPAPLRYTGSIDLESDSVCLSNLLMCYYTSPYICQIFAWKLLNEQMWKLFTRYENAQREADSIRSVLKSNSVITTIVRPTPKLRNSTTESSNTHDPDSCCV